MQALPQEQNQEREQKMNVKAIVKTEKGDYEVTMELNSEQHQFILEAGLGFLLATGALPVFAASIKPEKEEDGAGGVVEDKPARTLN
jgi:hypothetical protein